jgi:hypothetical protein
VILADVNVLVHSFRADSPRHLAAAPWWRETVYSSAPFAVPDLVFSGFLRVVTMPRIFNPPCTFDQAMEYVDAVRAQPNYVPLAPGARHWEIFTSICWKSRATGNLIPDAWLAALAIEHGCTLATDDRGFSRFPGLKCHYFSG